MEKLSSSLTGLPDVLDLRLKDSTANPAPLGLAGFGMTTVLLNLHNAGGLHWEVPFLAWGSSWAEWRR